MKTETTETKPSELAMKAAACFVGKSEQNFYAKIIDRETNLPSLLKQRDALREALEAVIDDMACDEPECYCYHAENGIESLAPCARCKAKSALALCDKVEDAPQVRSMHLWLKEGGHNLVVETTMDKDGRLHPTVKK